MARCYGSSGGADGPTPWGCRMFILEAFPLAKGRFIAIVFCVLPSLNMAHLLLPCSVKCISGLLFSSALRSYP